MAWAAFNTLFIHRNPIERNGECEWPAPRVWMCIGASLISQNRRIRRDRWATKSFAHPQGHQVGKKYIYRNTVKWYHNVTHRRRHFGLAQWLARCVLFETVRWDRERRHAWRSMSHHTVHHMKQTKENNTTHPIIYRKSRNHREWTGVPTVPYDVV